MPSVSAQERGTFYAAALIGLRARLVTPGPDAAATHGDAGWTLGRQAVFSPDASPAERDFAARAAQGG